MATRLEGIKCKAEPLCIALHPNRDILVAGLVNGDIEIHDYSKNKDNSDITNSKNREEEDDDGSDNDESSIISSTSSKSLYQPSPSLLSSLTPIKGSCCTTSYNETGTVLYTTGSNSSLTAIDMETNQILYTKNEIHDKCGINRMLYIPPPSQSEESSTSTSSAYTNELLATGDDNGCIRIWDVRSSSQISDWSNHEDFISGFAIKDYNLLSSSADGSISVYDLRKASKALIKQSDYQQDELLCISIIKSGKKVVCGTADGSLLTFTWNYWTDPDDKYGGHPQSIDSIVKINDEDTIITASSDGLLRLVQIHPNALLGVIANHYDGFPVEGVGLSRDFGVMATFSHDSCVRLWDTSILMDGDDDDEDEGEEEEETQDNVIQDRKEISSGKVKRSSDDEWDDDDDDDDNSDSDSDSDDSDDETRATNAGNKKQRTIKNDNEMFFADL